MSNDEGKGHLEIVKDGIVDLNDAVESLQLPGVSTAYSVAAWISHKWEAKKFEAFLDGIRIRLDLDRKQLLREMRDNKDKKWMAEGLARGWRLSLEAMNETARECAYFMVADYMAQKKDPDRAHRQLASLFTEADAQVLRFALEVADHLHSARPGARLFGFLISKEKATGKLVPSLTRVEHSATDDYQFESLVDTRAFRDALDVFIRNGLCSSPSGLGGSHPDHERYEPEDTCGLIMDHQVALWSRLREYLQPVRAKT